MCPVKRVAREKECGLWLGQERQETYPDVERLVSVARCRSEREDLRAGVGDGDLEVAVGVLLLEDEPDRVLDVDQEAPRRGRLFVVRQPARLRYRVGLEVRRANAFAGASGLSMWGQWGFEDGGSWGQRRAGRRVACLARQATWGLWKAWTVENSLQSTS